MEFVLHLRCTLGHVYNETVSWGDTGISLHKLRGGGVFWSSQNSKYQDLANFSFGGGGGEVFLSSQIVNWNSG